MRYATNGTTNIETDGLIPPGCWEITKEEFDSAIESRAAARAAHEAAWLASKAALRASAKAKLLAGEPLNEAEADLLLLG